jgi:hypothetical protein
MLSFGRGKKNKFGYRFNWLKISPPNPSQPPFIKGRRKPSPFGKGGVRGILALTVF